MTEQTKPAKQQSRRNTRKQDEKKQPAPKGKLTKLSNGLVVLER